MAAKRNKGATVRITKNSITIRGIGSGPIRSIDASGPAANQIVRDLMGLPRDAPAEPKGDVAPDHTQKDGD